MQGILIATIAYFIWGLFPLFFSYLTHVATVEVLANRIIWAFVPTVFIALFIPHIRQKLFALLSNKKSLKWLCLSALFIAINWLIYIWAVEQKLVLQASLGFFISPVITLLMGWLLLKEAIHPLQIAAGILAVIAVLWELWQVGSLPWVACVLSLAFACYGLVRKVHSVDGINGLVIETLLLLPFCLGILIWQDMHATLSFGTDTSTTLLLIGGGLITALPLVMFAFAVQKINYSVIGFLMYINPTMQFLTAIYILHEPINPARWVTFIIVWVAMALFLTGMFRQQKAQ